MEIRGILLGEWNLGFKKGFFEEEFGKEMADLGGREKIGNLWEMEMWFLVVLEKFKKLILREEFLRCYLGIVCLI